MYNCVGNLNSMNINKIVILFTYCTQQHLLLISYCIEHQGISNFCHPLERQMLKGVCENIENSIKFSIIIVRLIMMTGPSPALLILKKCHSMYVISFVELL